MNLKKTIIGLVPIFIFLTSYGQTTSHSIIPTKYMLIDSVALIPESFRTDRMYSKGKITFLVRLLNPTKDTLKYKGYSLESPWWRLQVMDSANKFSEINQGWFCGTGLNTCKIPPGMCAVIKINTFKYMSRIGVDYWINSLKGQHTVWTRVIKDVKIEK